MAIDRSFGTTTLKNEEDEKFRTSAGRPRSVQGVYIGIVKNNVDSARRGRLQVFIPELGGQPNSEHNWITVVYASPFMGSTGFEKPQPTNQHNQCPHTYGMWFSSPDIDNHVLVTFANGNISRGFWFATVPTTTTHWMVPALGSAQAADHEPGTEDGVTATQYPVDDHNPAISGNNDFSLIPHNKKPVHKIQWKILVDQGLAQDTIRGTITSSSHRESPSRVFGISTPGRPEVEKSGNTPYANQINTRKGGHTFVLDDGDKTGFDQLIRLRTSSGHQIMMNDTNEIIYIANSAGTAWIEFDKTGKIHLYGKDSISIRSENELNLHADKNINIHSDASINMFAKTSFNIESPIIKIHGTNSVNIDGSGYASIKGARIDLNGPAPAIGLLKQNSLGETIKVGKEWKQSAKHSSIVSILPTHEPSDAVHISHISGAPGPK